MIPSGRLYYYSVNTTFGVLVSSAYVDSTDMSTEGIIRGFIKTLGNVVERKRERKGQRK